MRIDVVKVKESASNELQEVARRAGTLQGLCQPKARRCIRSNYFDPRIPPRHSVLIEKSAALLHDLIVPDSEGCVVVAEEVISQAFKCASGISHRLVIAVVDSQVLVKLLCDHGCSPPRDIKVSPPLAYHMWKETRANCKRPFCQRWKGKLAPDLETCWSAAGFGTPTNCLLSLPSEFEKLTR